MTDVLTSVVLAIFGILLAAGVGFTIWLIQKHITDSTAASDGLFKRVTALGTDLTVHAATEEADLSHIRETLDDHIVENRETHESITGRLDRHIEGHSHPLTDADE